MYQVDPRDRVRLLDLPQPDVGAPMPALAANDSGHLELGYIARPPTPGEDEMIAVARFTRPYIHLFGRPDDEALDGHPLAERGLRPYGVYRIDDSSWIRSLERMNSVHPHHDPGYYDTVTHYVFAFHDSTFECVAKDVQVTPHSAGQPLSLVVRVTP